MLSHGQCRRTSFIILRQHCDVVFDKRAHCVKKMSLNFTSSFSVTRYGCPQTVCVELYVDDGVLKAAEHKPSLATPVCETLRPSMYCALDPRPCLDSDAQPLELVEIISSRLKKSLHLEQ